MTSESGEHHRRSMRLESYDYSQAGAYFVTICTQNREYLLGEIKNGEMRLNDAGRMVEKWLHELPKKFNGIKLDEYLIMPNHIHAIIVIENVGAIHELPLPSNNPMHRRRMLIPKIIGYIKMNSAKLINQSRNTPGTRVWQRNYYEHVIRNEADMTEVREYILNNPTRWDEDDYNPQSIK